jgi:preprotein translocase subunit SecG
MLLTFHIVLCVLLILVILLQAGKSGGFTTTFGGSSQSLFGSTGAGNFLTKATTTIAVLFFVTSIFLTISVAREAAESVVKEQGASTSTEAPETTTPIAPLESEIAPELNKEPQP